MTYVYSTDGSTIERLGGLPRRLTRKLSGEWETPTVATAAEFGYYPVTVVPQPDADHVRTVENVSPGVFTEVWAFSQERQDARLAAEDRATKGTAVDQAVATLRQWADDAEAVTVTSGNAVATLQTVVDRLGVFFDRFADLIESDKL